MKLRTLPPLLRMRHRGAALAAKVLAACAALALVLPLLPLADPTATALEHQLQAPSAVAPSR